MVRRPAAADRSWPTFTRFVAGLAIGRKTAGIDLIRRPSAQRHVRPLFVGAGWRTAVISGRGLADGRDFGLFVGRTEAMARGCVERCAWSRPARHVTEDAEGAECQG